jgi:hypothetical protein
MTPEQLIEAIKAASLEQLAEIRARLMLVAPPLAPYFWPHYYYQRPYQHPYPGYQYCISNSSEMIAPPLQQGVVE